MFLLDDLIVISASDITTAAQCEFAFLRQLDATLGRDVTVPEDTDEMRERAARLGDMHENRQLEAYRAAYGQDRVVEIAAVRATSSEALQAAATVTREALSGDARVVFQATFFDPDYRSLDGGRAVAYVGFADFLVHTAAPSERVWQVQDTKLARRARVPALLQLAAYAEQLERLGVPVHPEGKLLLGDGQASSHTLADIAPLFRSRRDRVVELIADSLARSDEHVTPWPASDESSRVHVCGRCAVCEEEVERFRDPLLIANVQVGQRGRLLRAGLRTIDDIARARPAICNGSVRVPGIGQQVLERVAWQAELQCEGEHLSVPPVRVVDPGTLAGLPEPNAGDLFFDFEGDPMYVEYDDSGSPRWGLDYLFGMVDVEGNFTAFWAHTHEEERQALLDFLELVTQRREQFPGMRIYHYAPYERTHLLSIAARHGVGEPEVDDLLRDNVLVDLYPIVRKALRVGSRSYSIKRLEPLYMGEGFRDEDGVTTGGDSVIAYAQAREQLRSADPRERETGAEGLKSIAEYNRDDCVSTLRLRDWLLDLASEHGVPAGVASAARAEGSAESDASDPGRTDTPPVVSPLGERLDELADATEDPAERQALKLAASAIDYYRREHKSFWWEHFARLENPVEDWAQTKDVLVVNDAASEVTKDWHIPPGSRVPRRILRLRGDIAPGSTFSEGSDLFAVYEPPLPFPIDTTAPGNRATRQVKVEAVHDDGLTVEERLSKDTAEYAQLPFALTPGPPPKVDSQNGAIVEWGERYADAVEAGEVWRNPVRDILLRAPVMNDVDIEGETSDTITRVTSALLQLEHRAFAVQGPPGTGKTYLAAHVMKYLVEAHGWKIGVVAQSHKVVENVLEGAVRAGVDPDLVAKAAKRGEITQTRERVSFTVLAPDAQQTFLGDHDGCIIGGTAWDFSNAKRVQRGQLDLLVIDEAGQFSLAPTIAASVAAKRLLLLGDPQQLPQVTQGKHPEPIDTSALGWLINDHDTLPPQLGLFLSETRRMRPELTDVVSKLSYEGRLSAHESTRRRLVTGAGPAGLTWHPVEHRHNATYSSEEADRVVEIVRASLRGTLHEDGQPGRALTQDDLIVVTAYNAQVVCVARALDAAGYPDVRVGTVDRFQGQEAVIAIVTLAASSGEEIPRGIDFLLMRNRLNVAISRAQWAAHLVSSPALSGQGLPSSVAGAEALAGYLLLTEEGTR